MKSKLNANSTWKKNKDKEWLQFKSHQPDWVVAQPSSIFHLKPGIAQEVTISVKKKPVRACYSFYVISLSKLVLLLAKLFVFGTATYQLQKVSKYCIII